MEVHNEQMKSLRHFWTKNKTQCCQIQKIDEVFGLYAEYHKTYSTADGVKYIHPPLNKYKFRTWIRKNGYDNSSLISNKNQPISKS
jgi:hypothetical protein